MGDRTTVDLYIPTRDYQRALKLIGDDLLGDGDVIEHDHDETSEIRFYGVNYGELDFEDTLISNRVPFSYYWAAGGEYGPGQKHFRIFSNGETLLKEFSDDRIDNVPLSSLKNAVSKGFDSVCKLMNETIEENYILSWEQQLGFNYIDCPDDRNEIKLIKKHVVEGEGEKGKVYLQLLHGRKKPDEELEDWGFNGPLIGPLQFCHTTYNTTVNLGFENGESTGPMMGRDGFGFIDDLLYFDGSYYGDWEIQVA